MNDLQRELRSAETDSHQPGSSPADRQVGLGRNPRDTAGAPLLHPEVCSQRETGKVLLVASPFPHSASLGWHPFFPPCSVALRTGWSCERQCTNGCQRRLRSCFIPATPWQDTQPPGASVSSSVKWGVCPAHGVGCGENELIYAQCWELCLPHGQSQWSCK